MIIFEERWYIKQWFPNLLLWPKCGVKIDASGVAGWFRNKTKQKNMVKCKIIMQKNYIKMFGTEIIIQILGCENNYE